ncbi:hypothetical protein Tco_1381499, partial [Tanacetum coccineum]
MTNSHQPPPSSPPHLHLRTTTQIIKQTTTTIFFSGKHHLISFLIFSFLLFSLQKNSQILTYSLTSLINHPSVNTLILNIQNPPKPTTTFSRRDLHRRRAGTLENDLYSGENELNHQNHHFFGKLIKPHLNVTNVTVNSFDHHLGLFKSIEFIRDQENVSTNDGEVIDDEMVVIFGLTYDDLAAFWLLVICFNVAYWSVLFAFVVNHMWVHGGIFRLLVDDMLKIQKPGIMTVWDGRKLFSRNMALLILVKWAVSDALAQLLRLLFFGVVGDKSLSLKIFIWSKFMVFSHVFPGVEEFEMEFYSFSATWFLLDMQMSFIFTVAVWVVMADSEKPLEEVFKEGWRLLKLMDMSAVHLKLLEANFCGYFAKIILTRNFGILFALVVQSIMEAYFLVSWNLYYFSVKS